MSALVSICIPAFEQTELLEKCLESILIQDFTDFEIIISDDTQNDSIEKFVAQLLSNRAYRYYRNTPALGTPKNWNAAIEKANGRYIKIMHHDDFFTQSYSLKNMVNCIENQNADFLFCQTDVWHFQSDTHYIHNISDRDFKRIQQSPLLLYFKNSIGAPSTTIYKNTIGLRYDENFKWLVDVDLYLQFLNQSKHIAYLKEPLICTIHGAENQVTGQVEKNKIIQIKEHVLLFNKLFHQIKNLKPFAEFFDYLFFEYRIASFQELQSIVQNAQQHEAFFKNIIEQLNRGRKWKYFKKRFFESRYNNYIFKFEQYI